MKSIKNTKLWIRVFFVVLIISLVGIVWQLQKGFLVTIKTEGGVFSEGIVGAPRFINPVLAQLPSDLDLTKLVFGSLLEVDTKNKIHYDIAQKIESSADGKTYTLSLKPDRYFQDGNKISADDVIFTIEKIQDPLIKSPLFNQWDGIELEKKDNLTIVFKLRQAYADFPKNLDIGILPKHIWKNIGTESFIFNTYNNKPIGSGPFMVEKINYEKSGIPKYYILKSSPFVKTFIKHIKLSFYENEMELARALKKGKIDAAYGLSANKENKVFFNNETSVTGQLPRVFGLFYNQQKKSLLKDKKIRTLIDNALDKEKLINNVFAGYAYPIKSPLGKISYEKDPQKLQKAIAEIEKDGWKKNKQGIYEKKISGKKESLKLNFKISIPNSADILNLAQEIQKQLVQYGVALQIQPFEESILKEKVIRLRDYEILLFGYMIERESHLYAFWHSSQTSDPGLNISLYENRKVDRELEKLRNKKEDANISLIEKEIERDLPASFIYSPAFTYILPKKIKGETIENLNKRSDRFSRVNEWYINTRDVWKIFRKK